ncbi:ATP-binding protein [Paraburkholderia sp. EG287A]|uniref:ATP-binding protein n=1 Tax=unclassified Paraburkholderia TaxID=2615204 RepID=UPI0034D3404C
MPAICEYRWASNHAGISLRSTSRNGAGSTPYRGANTGYRVQSRCETLPARAADSTRVSSLASFDWIRNAENLILTGPLAPGKTAPADYTAFPCCTWASPGNLRY